MAHVLHKYARRLEQSAQRRRTSRKLKAVLRDPHMARDIGLPPELPEPQRFNRW